MNILIPMGGLGTRFARESYRFPKPLVNIVGRPMLFWLLDHLNIESDDVKWRLMDMRVGLMRYEYNQLNMRSHLYIGLSSSLDHQFGLLNRVRTEYAPRGVSVSGILLGFDTRGAAETLFIMLQSMPPERLDRKTISLDCDTIYFADILTQFRGVDKATNASFYFEDMGGKPIFSYLKFAGEDDSSSVDVAAIISNTSSPTSAQASIASVASSTDVEVQPRRVIDVREKQMISSHANTGGYCFASGLVLREYCSTLLDGAVGTSGEYYTTHIIQRMLLDGMDFVGLHVRQEEFACVGTPEQLRSFLREVKHKQNTVRDDSAVGSAKLKVPAATVHSPRASPSPSVNAHTLSNSLLSGRAMRFCFDLDNTLVSYPLVAGDYTSCAPKDANIRLVRELKNAGHYVIIQTARRMKTHKGNVGAVVKDVGAITLESLRKFNIPYDELLFGKPHADVYVDDLAVHALVDTDKEIGWALDDDSTSASDSGSASEVAGPEAGVLLPKMRAPAPAGFINPRHFHTLQAIDSHIIKSALTSSIRGEIFFYLHIPDCVKELFPKLHRCEVAQTTFTKGIDGGIEHRMTSSSSSTASAGTASALSSPRSSSSVLASLLDVSRAASISSIVISRVQGVTYSHLLLNRCITPGRLLKVLASLSRLHGVQAKDIPGPGPGGANAGGAEANIYDNWAPKIEQRYAEWRGLYAGLENEVCIVSDASTSSSSSALPTTARLVASLLAHFTLYASSGRGVPALVVHGDPVFSNVLLTSDGRVVLIDMRGALGNACTMQGDATYDVAKVYQSIRGYDIILLENNTSMASITQVSSPRSSSSSSSLHTPCSSHTLLASLLAPYLSYLASLECAFWTYVAVQYPTMRSADVKMATAALFASLIPMHTDREQQRKFLIMAKKIAAEVENRQNEKQ